MWKSFLTIVKQLLSNGFYTQKSYVSNLQLPISRKKAPEIHHSKSPEPEISFVHAILMGCTNG